MCDDSQMEEAASAAWNFEDTKEGGLRSALKVPCVCGVFLFFLSACELLV